MYVDIQCVSVHYSVFWTAIYYCGLEVNSHQVEMWILFIYHLSGKDLPIRVRYLRLKTGCAKRKGDINKY